MSCETCSYSPCACSYIKSLLPGGEHHQLHDVALMMLEQPRPHRGVTETSCPCPACWSSRAATWSSRDLSKGQSE